MEVAIIVLSAIASELSFIISYLLIYFIARLFRFLGYFVGLNTYISWIFEGVVSGGGSVFLACYISYLIVHSQKYSEFTIIIIAILIPFVGEIGYWRKLYKNIISKFVLGRLHYAMRDPIQRAQFVYEVSIAEQDMILQKRADELKDEKVDFQLKQGAYNTTQVLLKRLFFWSIIGYIIGFVLFNHFLF